MKDEIYEYLRNLGFTKELLNKIKDENEDVYFISLDKIKENISFFTNKGLNIVEIINLINNNPFNLTLSSKRKNAFEEIYINKFNLSNEEIKYLLNKNNSIYTCSPIEFDKIINYLHNDKNYSIDSIKTIILSNPNIINKKLEEVIKMI